MILLITLLVLCVTILLTRRTRYSQLPSPGPCVPVFGHVHKLLSRECKKDPVNYLWNLYKEHQKHGLMYMKLFTLDFVYVGDFETLKFLFSHADCQGRVNQIIADSVREARNITGADIPGILWSEGKVWEEQRRFTSKKLRDFGFGKKSKISKHSSITSASFTNF